MEDRLSAIRRLRNEGRTYREAIRIARHGEKEATTSQPLTEKDVRNSEGIPLHNRYEVLTDNESDIDVSSKEGDVKEGLERSRGKGECLANRTTIGAHIPRIMAGEGVRLANIKPKDRVMAIKAIPNIGVFTYKCMSGGDLLIYPESDSQARIIDGIQIFGGHRVGVSLPLSVTGCKGVIRGIHRDYTENEVEQSLREREYEVRNVQFLKAREEKPTEERTWTVLISFSCKVLPKKVVIDSECFPVYEYKVNPIQCAKCCRFGHKWKTCRGKEHCHKCGKSHKTAECDSDNTSLTCINCKGNHDARSKRCPCYKEADHIQKLARKGMTYREAVKSVRMRNNNMSYREVLMGPVPDRSDMRTSPELERVQSQNFGEQFWKEMRIEIKRIVQEVVTAFLAEGRIENVLKAAVNEVLHPGEYCMESSP